MTLQVPWSYAVTGERLSAVTGESNLGWGRGGLRTSQVPWVLLSLHPSLPTRRAGARPRQSLSTSVPTATIRSTQSMQRRWGGGDPRTPALCSLQGSRAGRVTDPEVTMFFVDSLKM